MGAATLVRLRSALRPNSGPATGNFLQRQCACGQHTGGERCGDCKKREKMRLQRHANGSATPAIAPPIVDEVLHSPGQPMDAQTRALFEPRFDADFSGVRLYTDTRSEQSASAVNALAYTVGSHIVFGANQYAPQAKTGRRLLAHELTHTLQQLPGNSSSIAIVDSAQQEREAEAAAAGVFSRPPSVFRNSTTPTSLFRQKADPDRPPAVDRTFELDPQRFLVPLAAPTVKQRESARSFLGERPIAKSIIRRERRPVKSRITSMTRTPAPSLVCKNTKLSTSSNSRPFARSFGIVTWVRTRGNVRRPIASRWRCSVQSGNATRTTCRSRASKNDSRARRSVKQKTTRHTAREN